MKHNFFKFLLAGMVLLGTSINLWADDGGFYNVYLAWSYSGQNKAEDLGTSGFTEKKLGTLTSDFKITGIYLKCWADWDGKKQTGGQMIYKINNGDLQYINTGFTTTARGSDNNYEIQNSNTYTMASSSGASGNYTLECWFQTWGNLGDKYLNNGGSSNNYKFSYTIAPPAVTDFAVSATKGTFISGLGTEGNPYLVKYGTTLTLSASSEKAHTDGNSHRNYSFASGSYSTTTSYTSGSLTTSGTITVKACCINTSDSNLKGAESSTDVYYTVVYTDLQIADAGCTMQSPSTISANQVNVGSTVDVTAGTQQENYHFVNWTSTNGTFGDASLTTTTFKPSANGAKAIANWEEDVKYSITYPENNNFTLTKGDESSLSGQTISFTVTANTGFYLSTVSVTDASSNPVSYTKNGNEYSFTMPASDVTVSIVASYTDFTVAMKTTVGGTITAPVAVSSGGTTNYTTAHYYDAFGITATENTGYRFTGWTKTGDITFGSASELETTATLTGTNSTSTITANFVANTYTVHFNANSTEGISGSMADEQFSYGTAKALTPVGFTKTGYDFKGWAETAEGEKVYNDKESVNNLSSVDGATVQLYAVWAPHVYTISYSDKDGATYSGSNLSALPKQHTYDNATALVDGTKTGYTFQGWYKEQNCSGSKVTTIGAQEITANITLYAKWEINTYTISYPQTTEHYTISNDKTVQGQFGSTASFSITPEDGYRVVATAAKEGGDNVTLTHSDKDAIGYSLTIPDDNVIISVNTYPYKIEGNFTSGGDNNFDGVKHEFDATTHSFTLSLNADSKYKFKLWSQIDGHMGFENDWSIYENTQNNEMTYHSTGACFVLYTGAAGSYTFTVGRGEHGKPSVRVTYPDVKEVVILHSSPAENEHLTFTNVSDDIWETSASTALSKNAAHQFRVYWNGTWYSQKASEHNGHDDGHNMTPGDHTNWTMYTNIREEHLWLTPFSGSDSPYRFRFNASTKQLTVIYPSFITGTMNSWGFTPLTFVNNVATYEYASNGQQFQYKIIDDGVYYGKKDETTINRSSTFTLEPTQNENRNVVVNPNGSGTYTITYNNSTKDNTVQFPDNTKYDVTVYYDGITATPERAGATGGLALRAVTKPGYRFAGWVVEGVADAVHVEEPQNEATILYCFKDGGIVKATYSNDKFIYFKNTTNWGNVYVQFYPSDKIYMDNSNGTGTCKNNDNSNEALVNATIYTMTHIDKTDIWYYDCSGFWNNINSNTLAFTSDKQDNHKYFDNCDVVYRGDFSKGNTNLFVPENFIHRYLNKHDKGDKHYEAHYYDRGYWLKYQDTHSGWKVEVYDVKTGNATETKTEELISKTPGNYTYQATINLTKGETFEYGMKLHNMYNGMYMSHTGTITSANCTNWKDWYETVKDNCVLRADGNGYYQFTVTFSNGEVSVSVDYPPALGDLRVVATKDDKTYETGYTYKQEANKKDTASFLVTDGMQIKLQYISSGQSSTPTWTDIQTIENPTEGIMSYQVVQGTTRGSGTLTEIGEYKGDFYIRTDGVDGGWDGFLTNDDNLMTNYGSLLSDGNGFQYDFYKTKWVESGKNVKFRIANKYNKYLSADSETDSYISSEQNLQQSANVRFMWNSEDNTLKRAYLSGSTLSKDRFLVLLGNTYMDGQVARPYMFDENGDEITAGGDADDDPRKGLNAHELLMKDKNNWVYQVDIKAIPSCAVKLTAAYNSKVQYFIGTTSTSADGYKTIISGNGTDKYTMRVVYDFKTNLLIAGWVPDDKEIGEQISLGGDMLISRTHQDDAQQIRFGTGGSIEDIHHVYSVLTIKKNVMLGQNESGYSTAATNTDYERTMYWISFPFDVKISEVFGVDGYGKKWIMQRYNGEKRAEIGWFQETETFWEYLAPTSTLKAYKGYLLILNANYFNTNGADVWKNSATEANFYFPSAEKNIGIINKSSVDVPVPAHVCGIDRPFAGDSEKNHKITDSYWNVIGVPAFQNHTASATPASSDFKSYYAWVPATNTYSAELVDVDKVTFKTMHAYMVQFGGKLTWENVSVVNNPTTAPYHYADTKNYRIELFFSNSEAEDHAYINLADGAATDFVLNEDMMKIDNAGQPNIYSFAGAYDVAYNETTMENQSVMLGVSAPKDGSYTFAMPKDFSGKAVLVDLESGEATDLNLSNYTVELNKGTYNNRFQLVLEVEAKAPTAIDNAKGEWSVDGKTKKLLIRDQIYLINAGRIYNVLGVGE